MIAAGELSPLFVQLLIIFAAAMLGSELAQRLRLPGVVGEIIAGVVIGPSCFALIGKLPDGAIEPTFEFLAEVGVVFLMFSVGLHTKLSDIKQVGKTASIVAILGVIIPFILGMSFSFFSGDRFATQAFVGCAFVATSVGITARVIEDLGLLDRMESQLVLTAAVIDDILAMLLLAAVVAIERGSGSGAASQVAILALEAIIFVVALVIILPRAVRRHKRVLELPVSPHSPFVLAILLCLGIAALSAQIGLAAIIGAFLAGTLLADVAEEYDLEKQLKPLVYFLAPFFFVITGAKVQLSALASPAAIGFVLLATLIAVAGKLIGCGLGARKLGRLPSLAIGFGMVPRGEVGIIIAAIGLAEGVLTQQLYAIIVAMSLLTSIVAPPTFALCMRKIYPKTESERA